jgi:hypothetical protein
MAPQTLLLNSQRIYIVSPDDSYYDLLLLKLNEFGIQSNLSKNSGESLL